MATRTKIRQARRMATDVRLTVTRITPLGAASYCSRKAFTWNMKGAEPFGLLYAIMPTLKPVPRSLHWLIYNRLGVPFSWPSTKTTFMEVSESRIRIRTNAFVHVKGMPRRWFRHPNKGLWDYTLCKEDGYLEMFEEIYSIIVLLSLANPELFSEHVLKGLQALD